MAEKAQLQGLAKGDPDVILWYSGWEIASLEVDGKEIPFGTPEHDKILLQRMEAIYQRLHADGAKILIVPPVPALPIDGSIRPSPQQYAAHQHLDALYREFATTHPDDVFVADLTAKLCPGWQCGKKVPKFETQSVDSVHFTPRNSAWTALWLWPHILDTLGRRAGAGAHDDIHDHINDDAEPLRTTPGGAGLSAVEKVREVVQRRRQPGGVVLGGDAVRHVVGAELDARAAFDAVDRPGHGHGAGEARDRPTRSRRPARPAARGRHRRTGLRPRRSPRSTSPARSWRPRR